MSRLLCLLAAVLLFPACAPEPEPESPDPVVPLEPPPADLGFQLSMYATAPAGTEVWVCAVYDLPTTDLAAVNWVEYQQNPGTHHMTLSTLGLAPNETIEPGQYDCQDLYGDSSLMQDQIMFFGAQGTDEDTMHLPEGTAANFPAGLRIIHEVHYVNVTAEPIELYSRVNAWTIPQSVVQEQIWGGQVRDETIEIPAGETKTEWTRCVMNRDVEVLFLASHTHALGIEFTIAPFDGTETGEVFYSNTDWHDPKIIQYDPPMVIPAGTGFEYACTWRNNTDADVLYGLESTDEMCNLAIVHTPFDITARCEVVETSDGVLWQP